MLQIWKLCSPQLYNIFKWNWEIDVKTSTAKYKLFTVNSFAERKRPQLGLDWCVMTQGGTDALLLLICSSHKTKENFATKPAAASQRAAPSSLIIYSNNKPKRDGEKQLETVQASLPKYFVWCSWCWEVPGRRILTSSFCSETWSEKSPMAAALPGKLIGWQWIKWHQIILKALPWICRSLICTHRYDYSCSLNGKVLVCIIFTYL